MRIIPWTSPDLMRPIHLARTPKPQLVLVLTREVVRSRLTKVTYAPITSPGHGLSTEVPVGPQNGLDQPGVVCCDKVDTISKDHLGRLVGYLLPEQEIELSEAIRSAFDLEFE
jgi:mRNA interferase MazF